MNRIFIKWALLLCLILQFPSALSQEKEKWIVGHGDLSVPYIDGQFIWNIWEGEEIRNTIVGLGPGTQTFSAQFGIVHFSGRAWNTCMDRSYGG